MFGKCANPDCKVLFDYRKGRLIPVLKPARNGRPPAGHHGVEHFWLCANCSEAFMFDWEFGPGRKIKLHAEELEDRLDFTLAAVG